MAAKQVFKAIVTGVRGSAKGKSFTRYFKSQADMNRALDNYKRLGGLAGTGEARVKKALEGAFKAGKIKRDINTLIIKLDQARKPAAIKRFRRLIEEKQNLLK